MKKYIALALALLCVAPAALGAAKKAKQDSTHGKPERRRTRRGRFCRMCCEDCDHNDNDCRDCCPCDRSGFVKGVFYGLGDTVGNILP